MHIALAVVKLRTAKGRGTYAALKFAVLRPMGCEGWCGLFTSLDAQCRIGKRLALGTVSE